MPGYFGISRDDLNRLVELCAEPGDQIWMPLDHRVYRVAQPVRLEGPVDGDIQLHRIQSSSLSCVVPAWNSSPCCSGVSGNTSAIRYCCCEFIELGLAQPGWGDIRGGQPAPTGADSAQIPLSASNHNRLNRFTCECIER